MKFRVNRIYIDIILTDWPEIKAIIDFICFANPMLTNLA